MFTHSRPFEPLFRDPWWVFTVCSLFWNIKSKYEFGYAELIRVSPRFGILLGAMVLSLIFMVIDILSVTRVIPSHGLPDGINPFWKFAYIFKCLTDTIVRTHCPRRFLCLECHADVVVNLDVGPRRF